MEWKQNENSIQFQ